MQFKGVSALFYFIMKIIVIYCRYRCLYAVMSVLQDSERLSVVGNLCAALIVSHVILARSVIRQVMYVFLLEYINPPSFDLFILFYFFFI